MELTELLRRRSQQSKQTAQADCGDLGVLTVQALPIRECQALAGGPDGDRALLYAACRQLQSAGEQLRREGKLFRPDEIMQLVSEEEARAGAEAVRQLSGLDLRQDSGAEETPPRSQKAGQPEGETQPGRDGTTLPQRLDRENRADKIRHGLVQGTAPLTRTEPAQTEKSRLEFIHEIGTQTSGTGQRLEPDAEVRQDSPGIKGKSGSGENLPDRPPVYKIQRGLEENSPPYGENILPKQREMEREQGRKPEKSDRRKPETRAQEREELHETKSESGEEVGGSRAEFRTRVEENLHETKSESGEEVHEIKSEFPGRKRDGLHETRSEFRERVRTEETDAQGQSSAFPTVTEDLAREVAQAILDGLRRAAGAR